MAHIGVFRKKLHSVLAEIILDLHDSVWVFTDRKKSIDGVYST